MYTARVRIPVTYEEAKLRHPREVAASVRALRASSSQHKATAPSKLEWYYTIAVRIDSIPLRDIESWRKKAEAYAKLSFEERVQDQLSRSKAFLHASVGHWSHHDGVSTLPPEWEQHTREELEKLQLQRNAFEALPAKERRQRAEEAERADYVRDHGTLKKP